MTEPRLRARFVRICHATGRGVAERWRSHYLRGTGWINTISGSSEIVYNRLCDLGDNPDIDAVAKVIGNKGWSYLWCNGCGDSVKKAIEIGENETRMYCHTCIAEASVVLRDTEEPS